MTLIHRPKYRKPIDYHHLTGAKGYDNYVRVAHNLGVIDICECEHQPTPWRYRHDSGAVGLRECLRCGNLCYPLAHMYPCDECTEPTLADKYPVLEDDIVLCADCQ